MAVRRRSKLIDYAVYVIVRITIATFQALGVSRALRVGRIAAWVAYHVDVRHREAAEENVRHAFPDLSEFEIDRMVRRTYFHVFTIAIEAVILVRKLRPSTLHQYIRHLEPDTYQRYKDWAKSPRPVILLTGHFGNWEVLSFGMALDQVRATVVARPLDNPYLDDYARRFRMSTGMHIVGKQGAMSEIADTMAEGGNLGVVGDQDAGKRGIFVNFFGRPASTYKSLALFSLYHQAPILVVGCVRSGQPLQHLIFLEEEILPEDYADDPDAIRSITQRFTSALERMVRRYPDQYFWLHRRWKHQPRSRNKRRVDPGTPGDSLTHPATATRKLI